MTALERLKIYQRYYAGAPEPELKKEAQMAADLGKVLAAYEFAKDILDHYPWHEDTDTHVRWMEIKKELEGGE